MDVKRKGKRKRLKMGVKEKKGKLRESLIGY